MTRIDELLERATPNVERRNRLRTVFAEWERVKAGAGVRPSLAIPVVIREEPRPEGGGVVIAAVDSEEVDEIREELAAAGVSARVQPALRTEEFADDD